ncbi:MAG: flagellar protein FlgN [Clostridiales bacterium]|jgi:flagellar biosynthesis/type III secretory pathway chaperone|nr:flagellar protein FlgN [Clostridiales bacterium]
MNDILKEQAKCYEELITLAKQKKGLILRENIDGLRKITVKENTLVSRIQKLEKERLLKVAELQKQIKHNLTGRSLADILEFLPDSEQKRELSWLRKTIRHSMDELKLLNEQNKTLLDKSLEYVNFSMNVLRSAVIGPEFVQPERAGKQGKFRVIAGEEIHGRVFFDTRG